MIKVNDLRIGNRLFYGKKIVFISEILKDQNVGIYDGYGLDRTLPLRSLHPIPLTEELLLNSGIDKHDGYFMIEKYYLSIQEDGSFWFGKMGCCMLETIVENIKSLHHFQNIIFILTGKELEINL